MLLAALLLLPFATATLLLVARPEAQARLLAMASTLVTAVVVLFAAMPTGANAYIFAIQYQRLVNPVSGSVALGTLLAAATLPVIVLLVTAVPR